MTLATGSRIIEFSLPGTDGREHGPQAGRATAVVMWCNHCPYVRAWESRLDAITRENDDLDVIAVNANDATTHPGDSFDKMVERANEQGFAFAYVRDDSQEVARAYGGVRTPEVFLFDEGGTLRYHGAIDDNQDSEDVSADYLREAIAALRDGRAVDPDDTAPVGCTIKWRA